MDHLRTNLIFLGITLLVAVDANAQLLVEEPPVVKAELIDNNFLKLSIPTTLGKVYDLYYSDHLNQFQVLQGDWNGDGTHREFLINPNSLSTGTKSAKLEFWSNVSGSLSDLTNKASFPVSPDGSLETSTLTTPNFKATGYGARMSFVITAPKSGSYTFYLSSGGAAELHLSNTDQNNGITKIAEVRSNQAGLQPGDWTSFSSQSSTPISLTADTSYEMEVRYLGEIPNQHIEIGWLPPNTSEIERLDGSHLSETSRLPPSGLVINGNKGFFSFKISDQDQDNDSLSDSQEMALAQFHNLLFFDTKSDGSIEDGPAFSTFLDASNAEFSLTATDTTSNEDDPDDLGRITIRRTGSIAASNISLSVGPFGDGTSGGEAESGDFQLIDASGDIVTNTLSFSYGEMEQTLLIKAIDDNDDEHLETLRIALTPSTSQNYSVSTNQNKATIFLLDSSSPEDTDPAIRNAKACRFLAQASMGGSVADIETLSDRILAIGYLPACEEWIDQQFALPRRTTLKAQCSAMMDTDSQSYSGNASFDYWHLAWWDQAITSPEQLRHRMAFALSQIVVTSMNYWNGLYRSRYLEAVAYYDKLLANTFTSHRDLLQDITYDPFMGVWLSHAQNDKGDPALEIYPDENFAREVMQLFSCGVYSQDAWGNILHDSSGIPIENYDNEDIKEFAQVFTGLSINDQRGFFSKNLTLLGTGPMQMKSAYHDTSEKHLLNGVVLPANQGGNTDISQALDNLAEHPSTAPYFGRLLIQRFTSSNPSGDYINRVTDAWTGTGPFGTGTVGDFKAVLKAILLDPEVRNSVQYLKMTSTNEYDVLATSTDPLNGKVKEPILRMTQFYRFANPVATSPDGYLRVVKADRASGQDILTADTVFNFYDSSFAPSDGPIGNYVAGFEAVNPGYSTDIRTPETQILGQNVVNEFEAFYSLPLSGPASYTKNGHQTVTDLTEITRIKSGVFSDNAALIRYLNVMLCHGQMPDSYIQHIANELESNGETLDEKIAQIISVVWSSPACSVAQ